MTTGLKALLADVTIRLKLGLVPALGLLSMASAQAESISDTLIVLDPDGKHYTAQHWLATTDNPIMATFATERLAQETRFAGPQAQTSARLHTQNPDQIALSSGSVMTRYQHRYEQALSEPSPGIFELNTALEQTGIRFTETDKVQWSLTWILPGNVSLLEVDAGANASSTGSGQASTASSGNWQTQGHLVTYRQNGGPLPALRLRFSLTPFESLVSESCLPGVTSDADCPADVDADGIPDLRDLCLPPDTLVLGLRPTPALALKSSPDTGAEETADELGCAHENPLVLAGVRFANRQSYLDVASREVLERVARALQNMPQSVFEIRTHTDNAGRVDINQRDSRERAEAIRFYLELRGVEPEQLKIRGLGESDPAYDNTVAAGRRANRRTELYRLE